MGLAADPGLSAVCYAFYQILTRFVGGHDQPETSAFYSALVGTVVLTFYVPFTWTPVQSWSDAALMFSLGILGGLGHYCVARALIYAQANMAAPFLYWQMVGSVIVGYLLSGYLPDAMTWLGAAIIVAAGLYIGWRETREEVRHRDRRYQGRSPFPGLQRQHCEWRAQAATHGATRLPRNERPLSPSKLHAPPFQ